MKKQIYNTILFISIIFFCFPQQLIAQDSLTVNILLKHIQDQQIRHDAFFMNGIFPSYISKKKNYTEQRKDNNVFYTALILYTLKTLKPKLSVTNQSIADSIVNRSEKSLAKFKNNRGRESYNYWRTDSAYKFPFIRWIRLVKKNILADDPDCTSICLLALDTPDSIAQKAHTVMKDYANDTQHPTVSTYSKYKHYAAYSGWLWQNMPVVFDVCVLNNILTFVQIYNLQWTKVDSASLSLVIAILNNKEYLSNPISVSPYYGSTSVILYHLARLMSIKPIPALDAMKYKFVNEALKLLQQTNNGFEKIILSNALLKWGVKAQLPDYRNIQEIEKNNFPFVIANMPSFAGFLIQKTLTKRGIGLFYYYCPAYNDVLLLENLVLRNE